MSDIVKFFIEVRSELNKVVWPKPEEWVESTIVALILIAIFSLYMGAIDFGFSYLMQYIFSYYQ